MKKFLKNLVSNTLFTSALLTAGLIALPSFANAATCKGKLSGISANGFVKKRVKKSAVRHWERKAKRKHGKSFASWGCAKDKTFHDLGTKSLTNIYARAKPCKC